MAALIRFFESTWSSVCSGYQGFPWIWLGETTPRLEHQKPQDPFPSQVRPGDHPRVGIALSSGGAKGLAHIGVIQVLEENEIPVDVIAGTSMGAYVGALWASGQDGKRLEDLAADLKTARDLWTLVDPVWPRRGFIRGENIERRLRRTLADKTFEELERPLFVMATEYGSFARVAIREGDVTSAVMASSAIPGIVVPVKRDGVEYVDGGVCDPLPVSVLREEAATDLVIAVNVLPSLEELDRHRRLIAGERIPLFWKRPLVWMNRHFNWFARDNLLDILRSAAMGSQMRIVAQSTALADVVIRPIDGDARWHDYTSYERYIRIGREAAEEALPAIRALLKERKREKTAA